MSETEVIVGAGAVQQIIGAESEQQIMFARKYPRKERDIAERVKNDTTSSLETAASMTYRLTRENKKTNETSEIIGPSVRFAEIVVARWGNCRVGTRIIGSDDSFATVQGMAWDLESNFAFNCERRASIRGKYGLYSNDMIEKTTNANCAKAYRDAALKMIPKSFWGPIWEATKNYVLEAPKADIATLREQAIAVFTKRKIPLEKILKYFGRETVEEIGAEDVMEMHGILNEVRDGTLKIESAFEIEPGQDVGESINNKAEEILNKMKSKVSSSEAKPGSVTQ